MALGGTLYGHVLSTSYKCSPIAEGGLEIPLLITFKHHDAIILEKMKGFVSENYTEVADVEVEDSIDAIAKTRVVIFCYQHDDVNYITNKN